MPKFRKKPVVVEAVQLTRGITIWSLEGEISGKPGDWLVTGIKGEQYIVQQDIFPEIYDLVEE